MWELNAPPSLSLILFSTQLRRSNVALFVLDQEGEQDA